MAITNALQLEAALRGASCSTVFLLFPSFRSKFWHRH